MSDAEERKFPDKNSFLLLLEHTYTRLIEDGDIFSKKKEKKMNYAEMMMFQRRDEL